MKKFVFVLLVLVFCASQASFASTSKSYQLAEELLILNKVDQQQELAYQQMERILTSQIDSEQVPEEVKKHATAIKDMIVERVSEELSWAAMKDEYIKLYVDVYTEDELGEIVAFSKSPLGRKMAEKTPSLIQKSMELGQQKTQALLPEIQNKINNYLEQNQ